jgi:hypothetical protein
MGLAIRAFFVACFAVIKRWKLVVFFFLFNFLFTALLACPLFRALAGEGGHSPGLSALMSRFDPRLTADFLRAQGGLIRGFLLAAGIGGVAYYLLYTLFSGGMISILADPREKTSMKTFLRACGRFSFRFFRLIAYFALSLALLALLNWGLDKLLVWYLTGFKEYTADSGTLKWVLLSKNLLMLLLLAFAVASLGFAKCATVVEDRHFMAAAFCRGMGFTLAHPWVTGLFFLLAAATLAATYVAYAAAAARIDPEGSFPLIESAGGLTLSGVLIFLVLAQAVQFGVQAALILRHAGQVYIFKYLTVQETHPDPELVRPDPFTPFIPDRPHPGPGKDYAEEESQSHV